MHFFKQSSKSKEDERTLGRRRPGGVGLRSDGLDRSPGRSQTFSYHANRSASDTNIGRASPVEERKSSRSRMHMLLQHAPVALAAVVIIGCVLSQFTLGVSPKIIALGNGSSDVFLRDTATYQAAAAKLFGGSFYNRNKLTVDTSGVVTKLKNEFPELQDVSIALPILGHRPVVYVQPAEPAAVLIEPGGNKFVLDSGGRALMQLASEAQTRNLKVVAITDQSGLHATVGGVTIPSTTMSFIKTIAEQLSAQHIGIESVVLPAAGNELDVYISGTKYFGKFNLQQPDDAFQQVGTFVAVMQQLAQQGKVPGAYIDVRVVGRAYYK
jgi:hypothetical protein